MEMVLAFGVVLVVGLAVGAGRGAMSFVALYELRAGRSGRHGRSLDALVPGSSNSTFQTIHESEPWRSSPACN
jgi:hypothetical protein